jgi:hypothetical protein
MSLRLCASMVSVVLGASGCGTIIHGSSQQVSITSVPTGASVTVDTTAYGNTPVTVKLRRKDQHIIKILLDGYQPFELMTKRSTSGWVWGNIVFGGLIGLVVDASTGGMYQLSPEQIEATLGSGSAQVRRDNDFLIVSVVLHPEEGWERIGSLSRNR